jgi:hypothetical protein
VLLWALVTTRSSWAVDVFVSRQLAQRALDDAVCDEPEFEALLSIEPIPEPRLHEGEPAFYVRRP